MKVGDTIRRADMPELPFTITGDKGTYWTVSSVVDYGKKMKSEGLISKDDERWEVVEK